MINWNNSTIQEIKRLSLAHGIPIVRDNTISYIVDYINANNCNNILEIGGGIGYSSTIMALSTQSDIISLEWDNVRFDAAKTNNKFKKITFINANAFEYQPDRKFDLIFIDGPKANQIILFNLYIPRLNDGGTFIVDNIFLKKISDLEFKTKREENLLNKVNDFRKWLTSLPGWDVKILEIDDGVAVCTKKR